MKGKSVQITAGKSVQITAGKSVQISAGKSVHITAGKSVQISAGKSVQITDKSASKLPAGTLRYKILLSFCTEEMKHRTVW